MGFNYQKHKEGHSGDSFWTSYSDLFLGLSTIFLLLYVVSSLRSGTDGLKVQVENQKLAMKVDEMKNQLKIYEDMKNEYLKKEAPKDEVKEYEELMDKLTLLQEDAKSEKERLVKEAFENENKAKALNKYQQMVRNVLNANKVAKTKLATRDDVIANQDVEIEEQNQTIGELQQDIVEKKQLIAKGEKQIAQVNEALKDRLQDLKQAFRQNHLTKQAFEKKAAQARAESEAKLTKLNQANRQYSQELAQTTAELKQVSSQLQDTSQKLTNTSEQLSASNTKLAQTSEVLQETAEELAAKRNQLNKTANQLNQTKNELQTAQQDLNKTKQEAQELAANLERAKADAKNKMAALKKQFDSDKAREKAAFETEVNRHKYSAAELARKEAAFRKGLEDKQKLLSGKLAAMEGHLRDTEGQLAQAKSEIDARREIAREIAKSFKAAGVKADIDMGTGEVVIDFGEHYFDSNSANLKSEMKTILEKAMPAYSRSLLGNPKVSDKISSVEVIGFASPTYQGRYIDPKSTKPEDIQAIKYNMDLSYKRAKSIFNHVLDEKEMKFDHQKEMLALMRVSGRSFLEVMNVKRNVASAAEFCKVNDCKKAQRVIIKFSMDGKK